MIDQSLLLAVMCFSLQTQAATVVPGASIYGTVTTSDAAASSVGIGFAIVGVSTAGNLPTQVAADSAGAYAVTGLGEGVYTLRFERAGYIPLALDVRVPPQGGVHLDVTLDRAPPTMQTIKVVGRDGVPRIPDSPNAVSGYRPWRIDGGEMQAMPGVDVLDVTSVVAASPYAQIAPESGGGLHLQGGATDHTLLLLDGIPLYNAIHSGDHPSALDPDAVAAMSVYGEPRARDGGRLTGVVELSTRATLPDSEHLRTTIWTTGMRALSVLLLPGGSALISARSNYARPTLNTHEPLTLEPSDLFATVTARLGGGSLTGMIFSAADAIAFNGAASAPATTISASGNRLNWNSTARGLTWRRDTGDRSIELRAWQSGTTVTADWLAASTQAFILANRFNQTAGSASVSWRGAHTHTMLGGAIEQLSARYGVADAIAADTLISRPLLSTSSRPVVGSAFVEHSRAIGDHLFATLGERVVSVAGAGALFEPRLAVAYDAANGVGVSVVVARTHQYVQSLYNDESLIDAMASLEIPVLSGADAIPIASANSVSAQVEVPLASGLHLTAAGFARDFQGLALPGPSDGGPFPTSSIAFGGGSAFGGTLRLRDQIGALSLEGAYSVSGVSRDRKSVV